MRGIILGLALVMGAGAVRGDVAILDNLNSGTQGITNNNTTGMTIIGLGQGFSVASSYSAGDLTNMKINLFRNGTVTGTFAIDLWTSEGANVAPQTIVTNLVASTNVSALQAAKDSPYTIDLSSLALEGGRKYYVVASIGGSATFNGTNGLAWGLGPVGTNTSTSTSALQSIVSTANGTSWTNIGGNALGLQINTVPEPGTLLLGGIAAACGGGGVWWRRRRKAAPVVEEEAAAAV